MKKRRKRPLSPIQKVIQSVHNIELLDLETLEVNLFPFSSDVEESRLSCCFNGIWLTLRSSKAGPGIEATLERQTPVKAEFQIGYNTDTRMPQIGWKRVPKDVELQMAVDVVVGLLVAIVASQGFDPALLLPKVRYRKVRKKK